MDISIIIPAYNETQRIGIALEKSVSFLMQRAWDWELIVVDDGSADDTVVQVQEYARRQEGVRCVENRQNRGKGYSIRHGVEQARGRYIGFMDADYKTEIAALDLVLEQLEGGADGVIGDRSAGRC